MLYNMNKTLMSWVKSIANIVNDALEDVQENQHWKDLVKKYKTKQAVFAQVYQDKFTGP